ncbi:hypothetical protein HDU98_010965 [Podochytrium sp. JEL0797]|nr:hypothetical protein HDU98_010965 [Podochytrium sp. JEL0797]
MAPITNLSLWIGPPKGSDLHTKLTAIIDHFSAKLGTPKWSPHITLASFQADPIEAAAKIAAATKNHGAFKVPLIDIVTKALFFQCVMAKADETEQLMSLNALMQTLYPLQHKNEVYWPHLSLVYGDLSADARKQVVDEIKANKEWNIVGSVVEIETIGIWKIEGEVENWSLVGEVAL